MNPRHSPQSLRQAWIALAGLSAVFLFEMLDNSILNIALPTIGRELQTSTTTLQWVTGAYAVVFGGLMLAFGAIADKFGRKRIMLIGLVLLGAASLGTAFVSNAEQLIAVRIAMGVAAAMTTPGSMALAFRLFNKDGLRVKAITLISTVGLVGMAIGPTLGGFVLSFAPWQALLVANAPIALLAIICVQLGIPADIPADRQTDPIDVPGAILGTATIMLALVAPTLFVEQGYKSLLPWSATILTAAMAFLFIHRERTATFPLIDFKLIANPLVSSGLAFKAAAGLATAGMGYMVTLQLQLGWGWSPTRTAIGMLPQVIVLVAGGAFINPFLKWVGFDRAAVISAATTVAGLAIYGLFGRFGYIWVAISLVLVAAGIRVVGVVAGTNVLRGLPEDRTTIGAALTDTATEVANAAGIAVTGTILAALFAGSIATTNWTLEQTGQFQQAVTIASLTLTITAATLIVWGFVHSRRNLNTQVAPVSST